MPCVPAPTVRAAKTAPRGDAFAFAPAHDAMGRTLSNTTTLLAAPWMAFWAFAFEALNPENYRY